MRALIIDDESKARNLLRTILAEYCPAVTDIREAEDLTSGVKAIKNHQPDVVFLDVEMPNYSGLQILDFFENEEVTFQIVFTTAYAEYAVKAFELNAISYLLKPLRPKQVKEAVFKASEIKAKNNINTQLKELNETLKSKSFTKIGLPVTDGVLFVSLSDIVCFKAEGMYTNVCTINNKNTLVSKPLKYFEDILKSESMFFRTHRSYLINMQHINQVVRKDGGYILMDNDEIIAITKEKLKELILIKEV